VQLAEKELTSLQAEESSLEQSNHAPGIAGLGLGNVPAAGLEYLRAAHELQYQQALFDMLMKQYDAAKLDESKDAAIIQVVEPAIEPDRKSSPKRGLIVSLSLFVGFSLDAFWHCSCGGRSLRNSIRLPPNGLKNSATHSGAKERKLLTPRAGFRFYLPSPRAWMIATALW